MAHVRKGTNMNSDVKKALMRKRSILMNTSSEAGPRVAL